MRFGEIRGKRKWKRDRIPYRKAQNGYDEKRALTIIRECRLDVCLLSCELLDSEGDNARPKPRAIALLWIRSSTSTDAEIANAYLVSKLCFFQRNRLTVDSCAFFASRGEMCLKWKKIIRWNCLWAHSWRLEQQLWHERPSCESLTLTGLDMMQIVTQKCQPYGHKCPCNTGILLLDSRLRTTIRVRLGFKNRWHKKGAKPSSVSLRFKSSHERSS